MERWKGVERRQHRKREGKSKGKSRAPPSAQFTFLATAPFPTTAEKVMKAQNCNLFPNFSPKICFPWPQSLHFLQKFSDSPIYKKATA